MSVGLGTAIGYLKLDVSGFASGVDSAISDMNNLSSKVNTTAQALQTVGGAFEKTGGILTAGFTAPVIGAASASVKFGSEFDKQMSSVKAVTGATTEEFEAMREAAISWGEKTVYTATEAGEALYYMGLAGWDSEEAIEGLGPVLNLAAAGNLDLGRTSDIVTDALTAFGLTAADTASFTNILATAMSNSNTTVDMMGESFKYVAPIAGAFNYKAEDIALALGLFANNGIKASQAGTGLRQALNALTNPSEKAAVLMDQYGVSLFNADGSVKDFMIVMEELRSTFGNVNLNAEEVSTYIDGLGLDLDTLEGQTAATEAIMQKFGHDLPVTEMENLQAVVQIFGVRALPGMLSVINASEDDFYGLAEKVNNADQAFVQFGSEIYTMDEALEKFGDRVYNDRSFEILGAAEGMARQQMDNLAGDFTRFTSALGTAQIKISDMAKGALREFVQKLTDLVMWFNYLDEEQREQIVKWALVVAAIGPVLLIIGKIISGIGNLITTFNTLKGAFNVLSPIIHKFGSDISGFISLVGEQGLMGTLSGLTGLSTSVIVTIGAVVAIVAVLIAAFANLWKNNEEFRNKIIGVWEEIKAVFEEAGERIVEIFNELGFNFEDFKDLMDSAIKGLKIAWDGFCELLAPLFVGSIKLIANAVKGVVNLFVGIIKTVAGIIKGFKDGDWTMFWQGLQDIVMAFVNGILGILDILGETVWNLVQTVANWLGADWDMTWEEAKQAVADWFNSIVQWIVSIPERIGAFVSSVGNAISTFISNVGQWFAQLPGVISNFFTNAWNSAVKWGSDMISKAAEVGKNFINNIEEFFSELPNKIAYNIGYALGTVIKWVLDMVSKARELGSKFLQAIVDFFSQLPSRINDFITSAWNNVTKWASNMVKKAREMAQDFLNNIVSFFSQLPSKISNFLESAWNNVVRWATNMINKAREMGQNFLNNVVSFFSQLPGKIKEFLTNAWNNVVQWASDMVKKAKDMAQDFLNNVTTFFSQLPGKVKDFLTSTINNVTRWASDMLSKAKEMAKGFIDNVVSFFSQLPSKVKEIFTNALSAATDWVTDMKRKAVEAAEGFFNGIVTGLQGLPGKVKEIGANIIKGIWEGISSGWKWLQDKVSDLAKSLLDGAKDALGIKSPSREFRDQVGRWIPPGIAEGFSDAMPSLINYMQREIDDGVDELSVDDTDIGIPVEDFVRTYAIIFENLVLWYESMEERLANTVENMKGYLEYLVYVGNMINSDNINGVVIIGGIPKKPIANTDYEGGSGESDTNGSGDIFIFYSNESIDEIKAARLMRETKRDIAEGF